MIEALTAAGFAGVEDVGGVIYARLTAASTEFTVTDEGGWVAALAWPVRASAAQVAGWNLAHPEAQMDIWQGETRIRMRVEPEAASLLHWAVVAEEMVAQAVRWRRAQRAPGEGM